MTKCMRAIIKCLGVEVGEVFKITDAFNNKSHRYFRFTEADIEVSEFDYRTEVLKYDCFLLCNDNIIFSDYKSIFAVIIGESSNDFILSEIVDWFVGCIHNSDVFHFFESFKSTVAKMSENRDTLSKMSIDDINNMFNLTKKRLGYD